MGKATTKHHARLEQLRAAEAKERTAERELQLAAQQGQAAAATARQALVEAHASGQASDIRRAEKTYEQAQAAAEDSAIKAEAAALRVERSAAEAQGYEAEHARELVLELGPQARAAADRLAESARALYEAHNTWHEVEAKVTALLRHTPGPHDVPADHALASVARDLRNFIRASGEVEPPLPRGYATHAERAEVAA